MKRNPLAPAFVCLHLDGCRIAYTAGGVTVRALAPNLDRATVEAALPGVQVIEYRRPREVVA